ncbi:MAG: 5-formyltetrahydrofolate cyclo-ligase [Rhodospirillales bacterium]|nr:5-formyltetrahydrofolate cyclo-ligase [Rhodospirillales bacterium]
MRKEAMRVRDFIDPASEDVDDIIALFMDSIKPDHEQIIALYWPKGREFDPTGLLDHLLREGWTCALPVIEKDKRALSFARWDETIPLIEGPFGIMQPATEEADCWVEPDIICVPFLAFDRRGHRLGYGKGHYDATLEDLRSRKDILAVGLGYAKQAVLFNLPTEEHDQPLDWIITPQNAHRYSV